MGKKQLKNVKEILYWSYANLAMAHMAVQNGESHYKTHNYMVRARLYKGLIDETMNIRTIFDDEKIKIASGNRCSYCGAEENLVLDHILPKKFGGADVGDNLIFACRTCNSSKGKKDLMEWMVSKSQFPPLMVLRRYLKLIIKYCIENNLMSLSLEELLNSGLPFNIEFVPTSYPQPIDLILLAE